VKGRGTLFNLIYAYTIHLDLWEFFPGGMRLLNTTSFELCEFVGAINTPPYAILSHTWGSGEITFQQIQDPSVLTLDTQAARKISACCKLAKGHGYTWVWIDTCCIDKSSSAELSEAINSMYKWYADASVCYAYLADVLPPSQLGKIDEKAFRIARWFGRGWTLQELIAPVYLEFYAADWTEVGTKASLAPIISAVTKIPEAVLQGRQPLSACSVAQRMSWAAYRQTSREEDVAYCLFGLFDVNMPMLYGEGKKAFARLQHEIIRQVEDFTILVWTSGIHEIGPQRHRSKLEAGCRSWHVVLLLSITKNSHFV
jgi:hypothetical protein